MSLLDLIKAIPQAAKRGVTNYTDTLGQSLATPYINRIQQNVSLTNEEQYQHILKRARQQANPVKRAKLFELAKTLTITPPVLESAAPRVADPNFNRNLGVMGLDIASMGIPALPIPGAIRAARPLTRLVGSGVIRGAEAGGYQALRDVVAGQGLDLDRIRNSALLGGLLNTALSPRLTTQAGKQVINDVTRSATPDPVTGLLPRSPGFLRIGGDVQPRVTSLPGDVTMKTKAKRLVTGGEAELKRQGQAGQELVKKMRNQRVSADMLRGKAEAIIEEATQGLKPVEINEVKTVLQGQPSQNPQVQIAAQKLRNLLETFGSHAEERGLQVQLPSGERIPFKRQPNYFPRVYEPGQLVNIKASKRAKYLEHLVQTGQAQNLAEADKIFENFIKGQGERRAGALEYARSLDLPLKEVQPLHALQRYVDNASRRLTEVDYFGGDDRIAKELIDQVRQVGGDHRYAQEVFDLFTGQKRYKNPAVDLAVKFNYITKLDLGFITNATQPINAAIKGGVFNTLKGILKTFSSPKQAGREARAGGAIEEALVHQDLDHLSMGALMERVLSPFSAVERKNRTISFQTGKPFVQELASKLERNPTSNYAIRQLKSLGLDPELILSRGLQPEDILRGSKQFSDATQFKVDALEVPPGWKTNIGRLLVQFKSFTFLQTKFIRDEVIKEASKGNVMPLLRLIALAVPASFLTQGARNVLTGRDPNKEEKALDIRKWDKYLKAFGTMPTDIVSQGKFLADTYKNKYATPGKKVARTLGSIGGPTIGEATNWLANIPTDIYKRREDNKDLPKGKLPTDPYLEAKRTLTGYVPFVGEAAKNLLLAYPKDNVSDFTRLIRAIENQDASALEAALKTYKPEARKATLKRALETLDKENKGPQSFAPTNAVNGQASAAEGGQKSFNDLLQELTTTKPKSQADTLPRAEYNRDKTQLKRSNNLEAFVKRTSEYVQSLEAYRKTLDPKNDAVEVVRTQAEIERLQAEMQKYIDRGYITKGKKGRKGRTIKIKAVNFTRPKLIKFTSKKPKLISKQLKLAKFSTPKIKASPGQKLKAVRGRKIKIIK